MKSNPRFSTLLQAFFTQRLMQQKQVSSHTVESYRDTFRLNRPGFDGGSNS
jgi:hypothetical protein